MKAILVIPEQEVSPCPTVPCLALFPLMDRPFLQHVVEAMARRGIKDIQIVLGKGADAVERFLGDGTRWGCSFSYNLIGNPDRPEGVWRAVAASDEPVLVARADQLPALPTVLRAFESGLLFGSPGNWSGWAIVNSRKLAGVPGDVALKNLDRYLAEEGLKWVDVGRSLVLRSLADVALAQRTLLQSEFPGALVAAYETQPGVWLARNARVSPAATLVAPLFVGENTVVGPGATVGPNAVVAPNCMLDRDSRVQETTVCKGTYIGAGVELDGVIVDGRWLVNPRVHTVAPIDRRLLDKIAPGLPLASRLERLLAGAAFVVALPVIAAAALWLWLTRPGPVLWRRRFVWTPAPASDAAWEMGTAYTLVPPQRDEHEHSWVIPATFRGLVLELLPSLGCVAWGSLRLVGLPPRGKNLLRAHATQCPPILRAPAGLVTEASLYPSADLTPADSLLVDAYQTETSQAITNVKRVCRFLVKALTVWGKPPEPVAMPQPRLTADRAVAILAGAPLTKAAEPIPGSHVDAVQPA